MDNTYLGVLRRQPVRDLTRAVRAAVIYDDDLKVVRERAAGVEGRARGPFDVRLLVVAGEEHRQADTVNHTGHYHT